MESKTGQVALEMLLDIGQVMVGRRDHFMRVYDLSERVLPAHLVLEKPDEDEMAAFAVQRALRSLGIITAHESAWGLVSKPHAAHALQQMVDSNQVAAVRVETLEDETYYVSSELLQCIPGSTPPRLHILAPFDNLVISRPRLKRLFGLGYHLECYLPAQQRKVGYYSLPVLWGDQFVARLDPKAERSSKNLIIRNLVLEPGVDGESFSLPLAKKLADLTRFNHCERVIFERSEPAHFAQFMAAQMDSLFG